VNFVAVLKLSFDFQKDYFPEMRLCKKKKVKDDHEQSAIL